MLKARVIKSRWLKRGFVLLLWTLIGLAFSSQWYLTRTNIGHPVSWRFALQTNLSEWYLFALLSVPSLWLARRFRLEWPHWTPHFVIHLVASGAFSGVWMVLRAGIATWQTGEGEEPVTFSAALTHALGATFFFNLIVYWVIVSISHAVEYYRRYQERELRAIELEQRLTQARLHALQMQLNPHFLFNTLHAISALMHQDVEAADRMLIRLSDLLRQALDNASTHEVSLKQELDFLQSYLEIEQTRFGDRLSVRLEIAPETLDAQVPNLVLQPLVENAIIHGIEPHAKPGQIELRSRRENGMLLLQVRDNGTGLTSATIEEGIGLSNTRARLQQLYGNEHRLDLANADGGGLLVSVTIPFRSARNGASHSETG